MITFPSYVLKTKEVIYVRHQKHKNQSIDFTIYNSMKLTYNRKISSKFP